MFKDNKEYISYKKKVDGELLKLTGGAGKVAKKFVKLQTAGYYDYWTRRAELIATLRIGKYTNTAEVYKSEIYPIVKKVAGAKNAAIGLEIAQRMQSYVYSKYAYRRSFRTKTVGPYAERLVDLIGLVYVKETGFDALKYLQTPDRISQNTNYIDAYLIMDMIAIEIDNGNVALIEAIKDICLGDNNTKLLDRNVIVAVFRSSNTKLHQLMYDLLLAARLQEGLRQAILESADTGHIEVFIKVLKVVLDNDLMRYSSVVRAIGVWMGLGENADDKSKRITEKLTRLAYTYLTDESARKVAQASSDVLEVYVSLWVASTYEVTTITSFINQLMRGEQYQKLVALYFIRNIELTSYQTYMATKYLDERDLDVLTYILSNLDIKVYSYADKKNFIKTAKANTFLSSAEVTKQYRDTLFKKLIEILPQIPKNGHRVAGKPFEWANLSIDRDYVFEMLFCIAAYEDNGERNHAIQSMLEYAGTSSRIIFMKYFAEVDKNEMERKLAFEYLYDKGMGVRKEALKSLSKSRLKGPEEVEEVRNLLSLKTADIRQGAVNMLLKLPGAGAQETVKVLLSDKNENKRLAGLDMLTQLVKDGKILQDDINKYTEDMPKTTEKEKILINELIEPKCEFNSENGFGLYDPEYMRKLNLSLPNVVSEKPKGLFSRLKGNQSKMAMQQIFLFSPKRMRDIFGKLVALIRENREYEFKIENYIGAMEDFVLGSMGYVRCLKRETIGKNGYGASVEDFVLPEVWRGWLKDNDVTLAELTAFHFASVMSDYRGIYQLPYADFLNKLIEKWFHAKEIDELSRYCAEKEYGGLALGIIGLLRAEFNAEEGYPLFAGAMMELIKNIPADIWAKETSTKTNIYSAHKYKVYEVKEINFIREQMAIASGSNAEFSEYIAVCYKIGELADMTYYGLSELEVARAHALKLVPKDALFEMFFKVQYNYLRSYAGKPQYQLAKENAAKWPMLVETATQAAMRIIEIESKRGDTPTEVSTLAQGILYHEGAEHFANILVALGGETFVRGYSYSGLDSKKSVLSSLLKASHPAKEDSVNTLEQALAGRVSEKRLLEAAMYAPSWLSIVAEYLGWRGLESAAWYFHAHINETFSAEKETQIARYSPIIGIEFNDGAFDVNWFKEAYQEVGTERFKILYDCAKYLTSGGNHRRAQLFADASLGNLKIDELQAEIKEKRNKDKMLAYPLIPLKRNKKKDLLNRYEFIQEFLKESKQFGAQRRESEAKVCALALDNLARRAGFSDSLRLSWKMETLKIEQLSAYFEAKECEGTNVFIEINEQGIAALVCEKDGKRLKSVPTKLKKHKYIVECKAVVTSLKTQQKRAKAALEKAMIRSDIFAYEEVMDLTNHPVISPIIKKLMFVSAEKVDMYDGFEGSVKDLELRIAHSYDLYKSGEWLRWQKYAFANKLVQPFKQIFRELYIPNADELHEKIESRRYAGHQIQVQKTVALLKTRGWTVDYEDGLQKVYYKEDIIATMYAAADWFSPADVEAPTLETVRFYNRKTYEAIPFTEIPEVLFSEVMRDVDLVVSVAHVGGVDPEASHSTVEMRSAIVRELLELLHIENVEVKERQAFIRGSLGDYTVHLGSGMCQMMGRGAINILAVPSQHRGRVFLPFADEDPRTAEIMSKILLLAADKTIKDPGILGQGLSALAR